MTTIKQLLATHNVIASGFAAITALSAHSKGIKNVILSSLPPATLLEQGITEYYALDLPRGAAFNTAEEIIAADLPVQKYQIASPGINEHVETVIVSRHKGTVDMLKNLCPAAEILEAVTAADIEDKHVMGTLPPNLIAKAYAYTSVSIAEFDYTKDGDLSGQELLDRIVIASKPLQLRVVEEIKLDFDYKRFKKISGESVERVREILSSSFGKELEAYKKYREITVLAGNRETSLLERLHDEVNSLELIQGIIEPMPLARELEVKLKESKEFIRSIDLSKALLEHEFGGKEYIGVIAECAGYFSAEQQGQPFSEHPSIKEKILSFIASDLYFTVDLQDSILGVLLEGNDIALLEN